MRTGSSQRHVGSTFTEHRQHGDIMIPVILHRLAERLHPRAVVRPGCRHIGHTRTYRLNSDTAQKFRTDIVQSLFRILHPHRIGLYAIHERCRQTAAVLAQIEYDGITAELGDTLDRHRYAYIPVGLYRHRHVDHLFKRSLFHLRQPDVIRYAGGSILYDMYLGGRLYRSGCEIRQLKIETNLVALPKHIRRGAR